MKIMVSLSLFSFVMLLSVSMDFVRTDTRLHPESLKRMSRSSEQHRYFRHIMGKLIDTETNTIYNIDGQKQFGTPFSGDGTDESSAANGGPGKHFEDLACLEACYKCVEDYPVAARKKKAADNCGPMCDCADNCSRMPIEQVNKIYGQSSSTRGDKGCFWRTYAQVLNRQVSSLA